MAKRYLTQPQVKARYGGISDMTVKRRIKARRLPDPLRIGNRNYFDEDELDEKDREAKAEYQRAQAEPPKHMPPQLQNAIKRDADAPPKRPRGRPRKNASVEIMRE